MIATGVRQTIEGYIGISELCRNCNDSTASGRRTVVTQPLVILFATVRVLNVMTTGYHRKPSERRPGT